MRGWSYQSGFEDLKFNNQTITVGLIGDFTKDSPSKDQVNEVNAFISESIRREKLSKDYKIHGARLHDGDALQILSVFKKIERWAGWI